MVKINEQLGLRPAGKRSMMKLPKNRAEAAALTSSQCPSCSSFGIRECSVKGIRTRLCPRCGYTWPVEN